MALTQQVEGWFVLKTFDLAIQTEIKQLLWQLLATASYLALPFAHVVRFGARSPAPKRLGTHSTPAARYEGRFAESLRLTHTSRAWPGVTAASDTSAHAHTYYTRTALNGEGLGSEANKWFLFKVSVLLLLKVTAVNGCGLYGQDLWKKHWIGRFSLMLYSGKQALRPITPVSLSKQKKGPSAIIIRLKSEKNESGHNQWLRACV